MIPVLGAVEQQGLEVMLYLFLTAALLIVSVIILRLVQENGYRLILLGFLTAAVGIGFGAFLPDTAVVRAGALIRIAVILAIGGVGSLVVSAEGSSSPPVPRRRKGAKDAD